MGTPRLNVLLIVAGCDGTDVGEAWISFQWVSRIAQRHDVTVLTYRKRDKPSAGPQLPGVRVVEWVDLPVVGRWERFNSMLKPGYVSFYIRARRWLKHRLRSGETFDLAHQITPNALRYPSLAAGFGIPLIFGPVGGSIENPEGFRGELASAPWYTRLRLLDEWRLRHDPVLRHSYGSANCIICVAPYVKNLLKGLPVQEFEMMSEVGVACLPPLRCQSKEPARELRLLFVGRIVRSKGVRDAIRAVAELKDLNLAFDVVGSGDDLAACEAEARELGVSGMVRFHGKMPRSAVEPFYARADVFVFPSFREPSGIAVIEAMSHGLAMIVADRGGPGFVVDDECGIRIPVAETQQFASRIAAAIRTLAESPELITAMGAVARDKVRREFLWDAKVDRMMGLYHRVLDNSHGAHQYSLGLK